MTVTRDEAMDQAARCLRIAYAALTSTREDLDKKRLTLDEAAAWIQLARLADDDTGFVAVVDGSEVQVLRDFVQGVAQNVLVAEDFTDGNAVFNEVVTDAREVARELGIDFEPGEGSELEQEAEHATAAIANAVNLIREYGNIDGGHHKQWVLRQVAMALTGTSLGMAEGIAP